MTVLCLPYHAAADLAQTIAIACRRLKDETGLRLPIEAPRLADYLAAAVKVVEEVARLGDPERTVVLVPRECLEREPSNPLVQEPLGAVGAPSRPSDPSNGANGGTGP